MFARSVEAQLRARLAAALAAGDAGTGKALDEAEAGKAAQATVQAGVIAGLHTLPELLRLYHLLHAAPLSELETGMVQRILSDQSVSDPRQRLARAEDALAHRRRMQSAQARFVGAIRANRSHD